jgi:hypothetical protein
MPSIIAAPGDNIVLNDWQMEYNGLVIGQSTDFRMVRVEGLGRADSRVEEDERTEEHGAFVFGAFLDTRHVVVTGHILSAPIEAVEADMITLKTAFTRQETPLPLRFKRPNSFTRRVYCIPTRLPISVDGYLQKGYATWALELLAGDPKIYSDDFQQVGFLPGDPQTGVDFSIDFSFTFGGGNIGIQSLTNPGNIETAPYVKVFGPISNPQLISVTQSRMIQVNLTLSATDLLEVDFDLKVIKLNGASRYSLLDNSISEWWTLQPGDNTIQFLGQGIGGSARATFIWRGAWN